MIHGMKPVMSKEVEAQVLNAVVMYTKRQMWRQWGLHTIREQGAAILLEGPPGTGKTVIAEHLALKIRKKGLKMMSFADFGSHIPGENSRQIRKFFADAKENDHMTIYINECEAVLWDRSRAGSSAMWMLEVIDELLLQIEKYTGLCMLATNKPELLDSALRRRLLAVIRIEMPDYGMRVRLWQQKIPTSYPFKPSIEQINKLATLQPISGSDIETCIINYSSDCIRTNRKPKFSELYKLVEEHIVVIQAEAKLREEANQTQQR